LEIEEDWMNFARKADLGACFVASLMVAVGMKARSAEDAGRKEIEAFNKRYVELHLKMDTAGILALWAEDGVYLMPGEAAMIGRKKISSWVEEIVAKMPGFKVMKQEMEFHDIHICGEWASEWATEHQVMQRAGEAGIALTGLSMMRHPHAGPDIPAPEGIIVGFAAPAEHAFGAAVDALCNVLSASGLAS